MTTSIDKIRPAADAGNTSTGSEPQTAISRRLGSAAVRRVRRRPAYAASALVLLAMVGLVLIGPLLPLPDAGAQSLADRLQPPLSRGADGTLHVAGTDQLGRDVLSRVIEGGRVSIGVALAVTAIAAVTGATLGLVSGYRMGIADQAVMRVADFQMAFPPLLLAVFLLYLIGPSIGNLILLLCVFGWVGFARIARAQTLSLRTQPFVEGAIAIGCSGRRVVLRHILPHVLPALAVTAVFEFAAVMLAEAGLSFLGLGVQPPDASWGLMLAQGQAYIAGGGWWLIALPGLAIFLVVFSANLTSRWAQELLGTAPAGRR
jgi:peptide/nickel transport system permease protein